MCAVHGHVHAIFPRLQRYLHLLPPGEERPTGCAGQGALTKKGHTLLSDVLAGIAPSVRQVSADLVQILADVESEYA